MFSSAGLLGGARDAEEGAELDEAGVFGVSGVRDSLGRDDDEGVGEGRIGRRAREGREAG